MKLAYNGTAYHGWQVQPNGISVQGVLENTLSTLLRRETTVVGAGRTDAGVHAEMMVAHFDTPEAIPDTTALVHRLNGFLPKDIAIYDIYPVDDGMHARFSAKSRTYELTIFPLLSTMTLGTASILSASSWVSIFLILCYNRKVRENSQMKIILQNKR